MKDLRHLELDPKGVKADRIVKGVFAVLFDKTLYILAHLLNVIGLEDKIGRTRIHDLAFERRTVKGRKNNKDRRL